jgi:hypothetical protein
MASPINHSLITGGIIPSLSLEYEGRTQSSTLLHDNYPKVFQKYEIDRFELMILMGSLMRVDVLSILEPCDYYKQSRRQDELNKKDINSGEIIKPLNFQISPVLKEKFNVSSLKLSERVLNPNNFTDEQRSRIDFHGLGRKVLTFEFTAFDEIFYSLSKQIIAQQYTLPMKYLRPDSECCRYICQKSHSLNIGTNDLEDASVIIEPSHPDFFNVVIPHTPINQSLPLGTIVTLSGEIPYYIDEPEEKLTKKGIKFPDGSEMPQITIRNTGRKFISSNNLITISNIENLIIKEDIATKHKTINTKPWVDWCHYGAIEIGSRIMGKFIVSEIDVELHQSFSLFGFNISETNKTLTIWTYNGFNITPFDIFRKIKSVSDNLIDFYDEVLKLEI